MGNLWQNLKGHALFRVSVAYLMVGWIVMQIAEVMGPALNLPDWTLSAAAFILIFGLPITLLITWSLDNKRQNPEAVIPPRPGTSLIDKILIGAVAVVVVSILVQWVMPDSGSIPSTNDEPVSVASARNEVASDAVRAGDTSFEGVPHNTIAVLPFVDMSASSDQEYFADGVTDEIINELTDVGSLQVASRTSSFTFKGKNEDLKTVGKTLKVAHILEGSVRKQGDEVRITAQLIEAETGFHLWSETYDRSLEDIFEAQEDVARHVTRSLEIILRSEDDRERKNAETQLSPEGRELYSQARYLLASGRGGEVTDAIALLEEVTTLDPKFVEAWSALSYAHSLAPLRAQADLAASLTSAELNALRAITLDPGVAEAHAVLGWVKVQRREFVEMEPHFESALAINPDDISTLHWYSYGLMAVGKAADATENFRRAVEIDPTNGLHHFMLATTLLMTGDLDGAETAAQEALSLGFVNANMPLADIAFLKGNSARAVELASAAVANSFLTLPPDEVEVIVSGVFGDGSGRMAAIGIINQSYDAADNQANIFYPNFLILLGEPEQAFDIFQQQSFRTEQPFYVALWGPYGATARQNASFPSFARSIGLVEYWQKNGWPPACKPQRGAVTTEQADIPFKCS